MGARSRPGLWTEVLRAIQASEVVVAVFIFGDVFGLWQEFYFFFLGSLFIYPLHLFSCVFVLLCLCVCLRMCVVHAYVCECWHV